MSRWRVLSFKSQVLAVHAALLHIGHILYFGGDEHDPGRNVRGRTDRSVLHTARLFDCDTEKISTVQQIDTDIFCCGHAFLKDGRLIVAGGTGSHNEQEEDIMGHKPDPSQHNHFSGLPNTFIFDPTSQRWTEVASMRPRPGQHTGGRWYPTLLTLPNGTVLAMSGHPHRSDVLFSSVHRHNIPEIFLSSSAMGHGIWLTQHELGDADQNLYPRLHVIDGFNNGMNVFTTTKLITRGFSDDNYCYVFNPYDPRIYEAVCYLDIDPIYFDYRTTSVLLPLLPEENYQARVLLFGGDRALIIDPLSHNWRFK